MSTPTFSEVMQLTQMVSGHAALTDEEARLLYDCSLLIPPGGLAVEVGCDLGRSSSLLVQVARETPFRILHIDPFGNRDTASSWIGTVLGAAQSKGVSTLFAMKTEQAVPLLEKLAPFDFAYIDGDHDYEGVKTDLCLVAERIRPGGILCAHDYASYSLPGVWRAFEEWLTPQWKPIGHVYTLGAWKRMQ